MTADNQQVSASKPAKAAKTVKRKANVTRSAILITAAKLFAEKGYSDCNLREIAEKVGIKAGSFYYHFASKDQILDEILDASLAMIIGAVTKAIEDLGPDATATQKISTGMRAHVATFLGRDANSTALMRVYEHLPPAMKRRSRDQRRVYAQIWYDLFDEGVAKGEIRNDIESKLMVTFILAGMSRVMEWYNPRRMGVDEVCDLSVQLFLNGGILAQSAKPEKQTKKS